ncbi:hypothetical protein L7F22_030399 [Adiantum nelumboides]|nr:hypothetical protein [Adiantum nelumboides]
MATIHVYPPYPSLEIQKKVPPRENGHRIGLCKPPDWEDNKAHHLNHHPDEPSSFNTFFTAIKQCGQEKSLVRGKRVHAQIIQAGYDGNVFLGNCLVEMYGLCGSLADAKGAFDSIHYPNICSWNLLVKVHAENGKIDSAKASFSIMPKHDIISWSTMIAAYARHGRAQEALEFYDHMQSIGVKPNDVTFLSVLDACSSMSDLKRGCLLHCTIIECGYYGDIVVDTALVNMYGKCGNIMGALNVFYCMQKPDAVAWNATILACSYNNDSSKALQLYEQMQISKILPTKVTYICAIDACSLPTYVDNAYEIHTAACEQGFDQDVTVGTALTQMYGKCGCLQSAKSAFTQMAQRTTLSWNTMISACTGCGDGKEALRIFQQMQLDDIKLDKSTFTSILDACSASLLLEEGKHIHFLICDHEFDEDEAVANALINMYGRCSSLLDARKTFDELQRKSLITWTAMMTAFTKNGYGHEALVLFEQLRFQGFQPDRIALLCALDACICASALEVGDAIHAALVSAGYEWDLVLRTALVNMYAKCGSIDDSSRMFGRIPEHDVICWNTMLAACAQSGYHSQTLEFFGQMQLEGTKPDKVTFFYVLMACIHTGKVDEGRQLLYEMVQNHGLKQMEEHMFCLVDLLSRAGHLEEAKALISMMSSDKVESGLSSFLTACNIHGKQDLAVVAAQQMVNFGSGDANPYVSLSNICATTEKLDSSTFTMFS